MSVLKDYGRCNAYERVRSFENRYNTQHKMVDGEEGRVSVLVLDATLDIRTYVYTYVIFL